MGNPKVLGLPPHKGLRRYLFAILLKTFLNVFFDKHCIYFLSWADSDLNLETIMEQLLGVGSGDSQMADDNDHTGMSTYSIELKWKDI